MRVTNPNADIDFLIKAMNRLMRTMQVSTTPEYKERLKVQQMKEDQIKASELAREQDDVAIREMVIEELVKTGMARHVAAVHTNTPQKLFDQARKFGIV